MNVSLVSRTAMEYFKIAALICLMGLAAAAEEDTKDSKDTKKRDVGAILGGKIGKSGLDRGYLPPQKYYPGSPFGGQQVCDCRTGAPIGGYPGSSYPGSYPGGYPGGYPGAVGGGIGGGFVDDTVQVYPKGGGFGSGGFSAGGISSNAGFGPSGISSNSGFGTGGIASNSFGVSSSYGVPSGPAGIIGSKGTIGSGPTGSGFIGGSSGSSGFIGGSSGSSFIGGGPSGGGFIGGPRPGFEGPIPAGRPGSSIGIASSSYTSSGSVGLIGGADGYNYDRPSVPFP